MENLKCPCGVQFVKNYGMAGRIFRYPAWYFTWLCEMCGQPFEEKIKKVINLSHKDEFGHE